MVETLAFSVYRIPLNYFDSAEGVPYRCEILMGNARGKGFFMAREIDKLNPQIVSAITEPGMYHDGLGLFLNVSKGGSKSWILRYTGLDGKRHDLGLGSTHVRTLADARERVRKHRLGLLDNNIDPVLAKKAAKAEARATAARSVTFAQVADQYIQAHRTDWKSTSEEQTWRARLRDHVFPTIGPIPVGEIDLRLVLKVIEPKWTTMASMGKIRGYIENILAYATVKGFRTGDNPARWDGNLKTVLSSRTKVDKVEHFEALPFAEMGGFVAELRAIDKIGAKALLFTILTAARRGEVLGAKWSEIDPAARTWTIPADRMKKMGKQHIVPLSDAAMAILDGLPHRGALIFPMSANAMHRVCTKLRPGVSVHGMRSAFRDWAGDTTGYDRVDIELCLAHAAGDSTERAYRRSTAVDKRRRIVADWSAFCFGDTPSPGSTNIYSLRSASA
jgi:integrase